MLKILIFKYKPKAIFLSEYKNKSYLLSKINKNIIILENYDDLIKYLKNTKSDLSLLSISGYSALLYFDAIIKNTKYLGLVNKECVVSAGHLFNKIFKKNSTILFPLDSEHFSLMNYFKNRTSNYSLNKVYITASGGPFFNMNNKTKITLKDAINHPKWKMGLKNSIDSATLANKCLEIIEAHYLFNIPYKNIDAIIHPEALVHSVLEFNNFTSQLNYFYHDMAIPIINFLKISESKFDNKKITNKKLLNFNLNSNLNFFKINLNKYPIYKIFNNINKDNPKEIINFNLSNEYAVNLFINKKLNFNKIPQFIQKSMRLNINNDVNSIKNILEYQYKFNNLLINDQNN